MAIIGIEERRQCFACGAPATALWSGEVGDAVVCRPCALTILPALIADAIAGCGVERPRLHEDFRVALPQIEASYWKAAAFVQAQAAQSRHDRFRPGDTA
jgi:hypothetical protein